MERKKYFLILFLLLGFSIFLRASSYQQEIYQAYISNDMLRWKKNMDEMQLKEKKTFSFVLELLNYQYGYIGWCLGNENKKEAEKYLKLAQQNIQLLEKKSHKMSYIYSYKSALYGFQIGLSILKAPYLGPKSIEFAELAMKTDDNNPYGYIQYANAQYYMPAAFGGSKSLAIDYYIKAQTIMEKQAEIQFNWNYLNLLAVIGNAYYETKDYQKALYYYEKALKIEPGFLWVKNGNYLKIKKK